MRSRHQRASYSAGSDEWALFESVIINHQTELHRFAYRLIGGRGETEEALQNAYLKAFQTSNTGPRVISKLPWLYRVVYHCCIDESRRFARSTHDTLGEDQLGTASEPDTEISRALSAALLALPVSSRGAVLLVDVHGLSYDEAAVVLELPRGTVASRLNHGRRTLRETLAAYRPERRANAKSS